MRRARNSRTSRCARSRPRARCPARHATLPAKGEAHETDRFPARRNTVRLLDGARLGAVPASARQAAEARGDGAGHGRFPEQLRGAGRRALKRLKKFYDDTKMLDNSVEVVK